MRTRFQQLDATGEEISVHTRRHILSNNAQLTVEQKGGDGAHPEEYDLQRYVSYLRK